MRRRLESRRPLGAVLVGLAATALLGGCDRGSKGLPVPGGDPGRGKVALFLVERNAQGVSTRGYPTMDEGRAAEVHLRDPGPVALADLQDPSRDG